MEPFDPIDAARNLKRCLENEAYEDAFNWARDIQTWLFRNQVRAIVAFRDAIEQVDPLLNACKLEQSGPLENLCGALKGGKSSTEMVKEMRVDWDKIDGFDPGPA